MDHLAPDAKQGTESAPTDCPEDHISPIERFRRCSGRPTAQGTKRAARLRDGPLLRGPNALRDSPRCGSQKNLSGHRTSGPSERIHTRQTAASHFSEHLPLPASAVTSSSWPVASLEHLKTPFWPHFEHGFVLEVGFLKKVEIKLCVCPDSRDLARLPPAALADPN